MSSSLFAAPRTLSVLPLPGLHLDSLGLGLAALGLLAISARRWPQVSGGWRGGVFYMAGGPKSEEELLEYLVSIGERAEWSAYRKGWDKHQKADTKAKSGRNTALWRAREADEESLPLLQSHIAPAARLSFNPLFGTGGNAGKRDFSTGWAKATAAIQKPPRAWTRAMLNADLAALLRGEPGICLADYNAGCWFGTANKAFNSGTARPFRDGQLSPWAMALACEAFGLFQGTTSRRLGSSKRATGAFPFVTTGAAPTAEGEAGKNLGEFWFPVWEKPMSLPEVRTLYERGRAEMNGRGATTAPAFAAATMQRGVDAGIREFRRFLLLRTTSENTFESRLASVIRVEGKADASTADALSRMLALRESLPADKKKGKRWIYAGLRGPLDETFIALTESPTAETARGAVDAMIDALRQSDRTRSHRAHKPSIQFQQLPGSWAESLLSEDGSDSSAEARIGFALSTIFPAKAERDAKKQPPGRLVAYWLGVKQHGRFCTIPEAVPFRRVWGAAPLPANLVAVLQRRLFEQDPREPPPFLAWQKASVAVGDIERFLAGALDDADIERWLMRFSLFDWTEAENVAAVRSRLGTADSPRPLSAELALFAFFKPLFQSSLLESLLPEVSRRGTAKTGPLPGIAAQLARGDIASAIRLARSAYRAFGIEPNKVRSEEFHCEDPRRLVAALLIPAERRGITKPFSTSAGAVPALCSRWLSPQRQIDQA
jgi:CRISPR-associated protein Csx17